MPYYTKAMSSSCFIVILFGLTVVQYFSQKNCNNLIQYSISYLPVKMLCYVSLDICPSLIGTCLWANIIELFWKSCFHSETISDQSQSNYLSVGWKCFIFLYLICNPPPHVLLQEPYSRQAVHWPSEIISKA